MEYTKTINENLDVIWEVANKVAQLCRGSVVWTARQHVGKTFVEGDDDLYGFVINAYGKEDWGVFGGYASLTIGQARNADDALIRRLATEVMGYAPDSEPDLLRQCAEAKAHLERISKEFLALEKQRLYWDARLNRATHTLINSQQKAT